jgi:hypothetical protein
MLIGMARPAKRLSVSREDKLELGKLPASGVAQVRVVLRALALRRPNQEIAVGGQDNGFHQFLANFAVVALYLTCSQSFVCFQ